MPNSTCRLLVLCCVSLGFGGSFSAQAASENVLLIIIDDLNDWVGCLDGHPQAKTPNIDALAARGTLFSNAHCQAPICGPSRASFLSGRYPSSIGLYGQPKKTLSKDKELMASLLPNHFRRSGFKTYGVGKITHGISLKTVVETAGSSGSSGPKPKGPPVPKDTRFNFRPNYSVPYSGTQTDWAAFPERDAEMPDHQTAEWAVEKMKAGLDEPFFMAVGFIRPHVPFYVPQKWFDLFPIEEIQLPPLEKNDFADVPAIGQAIHELPRYPNLEFLQADDNLQFKRCVQSYLACIAFVDAQVGKVVDAAPADTHIVFISDHGYHIGEKDRVSKHSLWRESTRVPMVIVSPKGKAGLEVEQPVGLIDIYPTLCDLAGIPIPNHVEGLSLKPFLKDPKAEWARDAIRCTYARGNHSLTSASHHYIRYEDGSEELYALRTDPHGWTNLAEAEES